MATVSAGLMSAADAKDLWKNLRNEGPAPARPGAAKLSKPAPAAPLETSDATYVVGQQDINHNLGVLLDQSYGASRPAAKPHRFIPGIDGLAGDRKWQPFIEFTMAPGSRRSLGQVNLFAPLAQDADSLLFADLRASAWTDDVREGNFGLGYRQIVPGGFFGTDAIFGIYGFVDARRSAYDNTFYQGTLGVELMTEHLEFRANAYLPDSSQYVVGSVGSQVVLNGTNVVYSGNSLVERALPGFDVEAGVKIDFSEAAVRLNAGYFRFERGSTLVEGPRFRAEVEIEDPFGLKGGKLSIGGEIRTDNVRGTEASGIVRLRMPIGGPDETETATRELTGLDRLMTRRVYRDDDIVTPAVVERNPNAGQPVLDAATGESLQVFHVANTAQGAADCSSVSNACDFVTAQGLAGAGDAFLPVSSAGPIAAVFALNANRQQVIGGGDTGTATIILSDAPTSRLVLTSLGGRPLITSIDIGHFADSRIAGVATGSASGIVGDGMTGNIRISDVRMQNGGLSFANSSAGIIVSDTQISSGAANGITLTNLGGSALFADVDVTSAGGDSLSIDGSTLSAGFDARSSITQSGAGRAVRVNGGSATLAHAGTITQSGAATAISVTNATGGSVSFTGLVTASTASANAVVLTANAGARIAFNGGLDIDTTTGTGFTATGGGIVSVAATAGDESIVSSAGQALDLNGVTIDTGGISFDAITSSGSAAAGISLDGVSGGAFRVSGATTVSGSAGNAIQLTGNAASVSFAGATMLTMTQAAAAIDFSGAISGAVSFADLDIALAAANSTGIDFSGATLNAAISATDFDLTSTSTVGTTGVDLSGATGPGTIRLGDVSSAGASATIAGVDVGVRFSAATNTTFIFGDGESAVDKLSSISATTAIAGGSTVTLGAYDFSDVNFTGTLDFASGGGNGLVFVAATATGDGSGSDVNNRANVVTADAIATSGITFVLINDGAAIDDVDGFTLVDGQTLASFGNGRTFSSGGLVIPANFTGIQSGTVIVDPTGNGAAVLTRSGGAGDTLVASGTVNLQDFIVENAASGAGLSATGATTISATGLTVRNVDGQGIDLDGLTGAGSTFNRTTVSTTTGNAIDIVNSTVTFTGGLDIDTTSGTGFTATGGATVTVMASAGDESIIASAGRAVNLSSVTIGAGGMHFDSLTSTNSAGSGITLAGVSGGTFAVSGTTTVSGAAGNAIELAANTAAIEFGATGVTLGAGAGSAGVDFSGLGSGAISFGVTTISSVGAAANQTGLDFSGATLGAAVNFTSVAISGPSTSISSIGVDLTGVLGNQAVNLGSQAAPATGPSSSITGLHRGVVIDAASAVQFTFGDGEGTSDRGSSIDVNGLAGSYTVDAGSGTLAGSSFDFNDVTFGAGDVANFPTTAVPVFVSTAGGLITAGTNNLSQDLTTITVAAAEALADTDQTFVFVGDGTGIIDLQGGGLDGFTLDAGQSVISFNGGNAISLGVTKPANIEGAFNIPGTVTSDDVTVRNDAGGATSVIATAAGGNHTIANFSISTGATGVLIDGATAALNLTNIAISGIAGAGTGVSVLNAQTVITLNNVDISGTATGIDNQSGVSGSVSADAASSITNTTAFAVNLDQNASGFAFAGTISETDGAGAGIRVNQHGGTADFSGMVTLNTGTSGAVALTANTGSVSFTGGLDIDTTTGTGFSATGGGSVTVAATAGAESITVGDGVAVVLNGLTTDVSFDMINVDNTDKISVNLDNLDGSFTLRGGTFNTAVTVSVITIDVAQNDLAATRALTLDISGITVTHDATASNIGANEFGIYVRTAGDDSATVAISNSTFQTEDSGIYMDGTSGLITVTDLSDVTLLGSTDTFDPMAFGNGLTLEHVTLDSDLSTAGLQAVNFGTFSAGTAAQKVRGGLYVRGESSGTINIADISAFTYQTALTVGGNQPSLVVNVANGTIDAGNVSIGSAAGQSYGDITLSSLTLRSNVVTSGLAISNFNGAFRVTGATTITAPELLTDLGGGTYSRTTSRALLVTDSAATIEFGSISFVDAASIPTATGTVILSNGGPTNAIVLDGNTGSFTVSGATTIASTVEDAIVIRGTAGAVSFGQTTINAHHTPIQPVSIFGPSVEAVSAGVDIEGTIGGAISFSSLTVDLTTDNSTAVDLSFAVINANVTAGDFDVSTTSSTGTVGVDLRGTTGTGTVQLGDTNINGGPNVTLGSAANMLSVGVEVSAATNLAFVLGDGNGAAGDLVASNMHATQAINGTLPTLGSYNFRDINFNASGIANLSGGATYFVFDERGTTGAGTFADPGNAAQAAAANVNVLVAVDNSGTAGSTIDLSVAGQGAINTLTLDDNQALIALASGEQVDATTLVSGLTGGAPASFLLTNVGGSSTITGSGVASATRPTITTTGANTTIALSGRAGLQNLILANGGSGDAVSASYATAQSVIIRSSTISGGSGGDAIDISTTAGASTFEFDGLTLLSGLRLDGSAGGSLTGTATGTNTLANAAGIGLSLDTVAIGAGGFTFDSVSSTGAGDGNSGILLTDLTGGGGVTITSATVVNSGGASGGHAIDLANIGTTGALTIAAVDIDLPATGGSGVHGIRSQGGHTATINLGTGAGGIDIRDANIGIQLLGTAGIVNIGVGAGSGGVHIGNANLAFGIGGDSTGTISVGNTTNASTFASTGVEAISVSASDATITFTGIDINAAASGAGGYGIWVFDNDAIGSFTLNGVNTIDNTGEHGIRITNATASISGVTFGASATGAGDDISGSGILIENSDGLSRTVTLADITMGTGGNGDTGDVAGNAINISATGAGTLTVNLSGTNVLRSTGAAITTQTASTANLLRLGLSGTTTAESATAGATIAINGDSISSSANSTVVTGFGGVTVIGNGVSGGVLLDNVTFDANVANGIGTSAPSADQVSFGTLQIGQSGAARVSGNGLSFNNAIGDVDIATLDIFNTSGTGLYVNTKTPTGGGATNFELTGGGSGTVDTTNGTALFLDPLAMNLAFGTVSSTGSSASGVFVDGGDASAGAGTNALSITNLTISGSTDAGLVITNSTGNFSFGATTITNTGTAGGGVDLDLGAGDTMVVNFSNGLVIATAGGTGFDADGQAGTSLTVNVSNAATETITTTFGTTLRLDSVQAGINLDSVTATGLAGNAGLAFQRLAGSLTVGGGTITNTGAGNGIQIGAVGISAGNATVNIATAINSTGATGRAALIQGVAGGSVTLSGTLTDDSAAGGGIALQSNTGGTITFSGATKQISTGGSAALTLSGNAGATISFTGGGLDIDTTSGTGILASSGGTLNVAGAGNTVNTATGAVLNLNNIVIGGSGMTFATLAVSGSATGDAILLNNVDGGAFSGGTVSIAGASGDGIEVSGGSSSNVSFGATTIAGVNGRAMVFSGTTGTVNVTSAAITNLATAATGIEIGSTGGVTFGDVDITNLATNGRGVDLRTASGTVTFSTLDISSAALTTGTRGIDLTGATNASNMTITNPSTINNLAIGVDLTNANIGAGATFRYGDGSAPTASAISNTTTAIVVTGLSANGTYDFTDVGFAGSGTSNLSSGASGSIYWVSASGVGDGSSAASAGSITNAAAAAGITYIVLLDTAGGGQDTINLGASSLVLDPGQSLLSFNGQDSIGVSGGPPANVLLTGIGGGGTISNPNPGSGAPLLTSSAAQTVTLAAGSTIDGLHITNTAAAGTRRVVYGLNIDGSATIRNSLLTRANDGRVIDFLRTTAVTTTFEITGNTIQSGDANNVVIQFLDSGPDSADIVFGTISNNIITAAGRPEAITLNVSSVGTARFAFTGNTFNDVGEGGLSLYTFGAAQVDLTVQGNTFAGADGSTFDYIFLQINDTSTVCANIGGTGAQANTFVAPAVIDFAVATTGQLHLPGYGGGDVNSYLQGRNTGTLTTGLLDSGPITGGSVCTLP
ncbi:hypothetical protein AWJ14_07060 [Hoeflea olei]|uniref:Inverse autotransporter beta-domain domain-containing protein n=1 Tax=Hoeflea olei TaxID=1480615 RepID=A0A1C1YTT8_9HYPH|nr:hypothetical protein AWJ14_07060 [Hoeflea olei]